MSRFRCFDTYNLKNISSSQRTNEVRRKTIFTEFQTIAIGNVSFQKGLNDNAIPPGYMKKDNGSYFYGPIYVSTDDIALNNCLVGAKNYELLYDVLFGAQTSPDDIKYSIVTYDGAAWQGNIFKTDTKTVGTIGPAITNIPNGEPDKTNYAARQDFLPNYNQYPNPPEEFPGIVIDPCYNMFYPRCANEYIGNNYIKNVKFNFTNAELENSELVNYLKTSSAKRYIKFPYQLNFQNTTCEKYPFSFVFSFINNVSSERANDILLKYMPIININNTISYDITYSFSGIRDEKLTYTINFKYTGAPSDVDGLTFYPNGPTDTSLVDFYNSTTDFTIHSFNLIPLSPLGYQFKNLKFILEATDIPIIKPNTSLDEAFKGTTIIMPENTNNSINNLMRSFMILDDFTINFNRTNSISNWRTSGVISMNSTFMDSNFNGELNGWITSNVLDMRSIFENNESFNQNINDWDISKINDMNQMFLGATSFNQPLNNWDTSNVVNMTSVFKGASSFNQNLNNWKIDNVTNMSEMFMNATSFNGQINNWNTEKVEDMSFLFKNASSFNQNISYDNELNYWNTYNVQTFESTFEGTQKFNNGEAPLSNSIIEQTNPLNWINIYNFLPNSSYPKTVNITFKTAYDAIGLTRLNALPFSKPYTVLYEYYDNSGTSFNDIRDNYLPYIINGLSTFDILEITPPEPTIGYRMVKFSIIYNSTDENTGFTFYEENDKKINYYNQVGSGNFIRILNFDTIPLAKNGHQFSKLINLDISSSTIVTIEPNTSLNDSFYRTTNLKISNNIEFWNIENVVNMSNMFKDSSFNDNISKWNTSNVEDMSSMFENNTIFNQDLSKWNTDKVVNMSRMFKNAYSFNSKLTYYSDSSNNYWDVSGVLNMSSMFENALSFNNGQEVGESIEKLNWTLNPLVNYTHVRTNANSLTNDNAFPLPYYYTMKYEFYNKNNRSNEDISNNIPILIAGPSSIINTNVTDDTKPNYKLVETTVSFPNHIQDLSSGFSFINVKSFFNETYGDVPHKITQFGGIPLALNNNLSPPDGYQFADLSCVIDFSANDSFSILPNTTLSYCFYNNKFFNSSLNWDTSEVISMKSMFEESAFNKVINFNTNRVIDMSNMFKNSEFNQNISYSENSSYWDVRNVLDMTSIFENALFFNNGFDVGEKTHPLNWILNPNVKAVDCIKNANAITYENAYPLAEIVGQFTYKFYNTENLTSIDISNSYLPIIKTSDINLNYYYSPLITIDPSNQLTTVIIYFRYNDISSNVIDGLSFNNVSSIYNVNYDPKIISNFSNIPLARENGSNEGKQFSNINNLIFDSDTNPTILPNTTFKDIFNNSFFNYDINEWDITGVTSLNGAFANTQFNKPLNKWNTSNVVDMSGVFYNNNFFNQPIGSWDVSNVNNMESMFYNCLNFNQNLSNWNTMNVYTFNQLFFNCNKFNNGDVIGDSNIPLTWNTSNLQNLHSTFYKAISFNQDISGWNISNVTTIENLFREAESFNQPIGEWNVSNITNMKSAFYNAIKFNQSISDWNTINVNNMYSMFRNAESFNKNISFNILNNSWNTSNVLNMVSIFEGAISFNNGFEIGDIDNPLNWNLNPSVNTINATVNASFLSVSNAKPLEKIIKGAFIYTFYNNTNETDEDILNKYIPIINKNNSFIEFVSSISHPLVETDISFTKVEILYSYVDIDNSNNIDGLTFFDISGIKTSFYNSTRDKLTILDFGSIPISREGYQFANLKYFDASLNIDDPFNKPTFLFNTSLKYAFYNTNFEINSNIDIQKWDTIFVNDMTSMFENSSFNKPIRINTKNVKIMNSMFKNAINFNQNISYNSSINVNIWNTSNVIDMSYMFEGASSFNNGEIEEETTQPLDWILNPLVELIYVRRNTPKLTNKNSFPLPSIYTLKYNFYDNTGISGDYIIDNYIPIILNGKSMFYNIYVIPYENIKSEKNVTVEFAYMNDISNTGLSFYNINNKIVDFYNNNNNVPLTITQFDNIPLSRNDGSEPPNGYQFSKLNLIDFSANDTLTILPNTTLSYCFYNSINFNSDINNWDLSNVETTKSMFEGATSFNKPLQNWNTSNVKNMENMFKNASSFNQTIKYNPDLNYWNVSSVSNMISIFEGATNFNNGFPPYNYDVSLNWILNENVDKTNSYKNAPFLTDYNGLPITSSIYYPDEFIYKFYNVHNETTKNILLNYLPFIKTNNLIFDINKNVMVEQISETSQETRITVRFSFDDDGLTQDGLNFNATPDIVYFYNITEQPVEIIQFGNIPLSRYYNNKEQLFWETTIGTKFSSFGYSVTSGNNKWISVGGIKTNTILRSLDGRNWQTVSGITFNGIGYAVLNGNGTTWIAVGDDYGGQNTILRSIDDGASWVSVSGVKFTYAGYGIEYGNNKWLVVGDDNKGQNTILTSTNDGETWDSVTGISFSLAGFGVAYNGIDRWVAVGAGTHTILTSTDGNNWVDVSGVQFGLYGQSVLYRFGRWVAIGHDNNGYNTILTSTNGTYWYPVSGTTFSSYAQSLAYGNGRWVAVGYDNGGPNTILTSTNGIDWSECLFGTFTFAGYGVSYMETYNLWVAVGDNGLNYNSILTSNNGIQWYPVIGSKFKFTGYGISNNNNEWVSVGNHYTYTFGEDVESLDNPTYEGTGPYPQSAPIDETNANAIDDDSLLIYNFKLERSSKGVITEIGGSANGSCITIYDNANVKTLRIYHFKKDTPDMDIEKEFDIDRFVEQDIQLVLYLIRDNITGYWNVKVVINNELVDEYNVNFDTNLAGGNFTSVGGIDPDTSTLPSNFFKTTENYSSPFYSHKLWYSTLLDNSILYSMV